MNLRGLVLVPMLSVAACARSSTAAPPSPDAPATRSTEGPVASLATPAASTAPVATGLSGASQDPLVGAPAPDFTATAHDGTAVHLAGLRGKQVALYFYPRDETPGCTKEACSFRDSWAAIAKTGAVLVGVSADTLDSHRQFVSHHNLPFLLVSDPTGSIAKLYGVPFAAVHQRQTVIIGADGRVKKVYRHVDVGVHAKEVLADLGGSP